MGGRTPVKADVRIICTTNGDVTKLRRDLFYRIAGVHITLPSLAERREDIPDLVEYLQNRATRKLSKSPVFSRQDSKSLMAYPWPGNVRQLESYVEESVALGAPRPLKDARLEQHDDGSGYSSARALDPPIISGLSLAEVKKKYILRTLEQHAGNRTTTAQVLGMSVRGLQKNLAEYGIEPGRPGRRSYRDVQPETSLNWYRRNETV